MSYFVSMAKKKTKYKQKEYKKRDGITPSFTTRDPSKEEMDEWIEKNIVNKKKNKKK